MFQVVGLVLGLTLHAQPVSTFEQDIKSQRYLTELVRCQMGMAQALAEYSDMQDTEAAQNAITACEKERKAWVENEVARGTPRNYAEYAINTDIKCRYPMLLTFIDLKRRHASQAEIEQWSAGVRAKEATCD